MLKNNVIRPLHVVINNQQISSIPDAFKELLSIFTSRTRESLYNELLEFEKDIIADLNKDPANASLAIPYMIGALAIETILAIDEEEKQERGEPHHGS